MKLFFTILFLFISTLIGATDYYIDSNIKLRDISPIAGDRIFLKRGNIFTEPIIIKVDNITVSTYGHGEKPIVSGFKNITDWTYKGDNIWESVDSISYSNVVIINGISRPRGRWPNWKDIPIPEKRIYTDSSWIHATAFPTNNSMTSVSGDWTGGELILRPRKYLFQKNKIISHIGDTINYIRENGYTSSAKSAEYFIQNHIGTLDTEGEWYCNSKLFVYSENKPVAKVAVVDNLLTIEGSYITIDNISLKGANRYGIFISGLSHVTVKNCDIDYTHNAIYGYFGWKPSEYMTVCNNMINHTNNNAISFQHGWGYQYQIDHVLISGNIIKNTGLFAGMGESGEYYSIALAYTNNSVISFNHIDSVGHTGITITDGDNLLVTKNFINNFCLILDDGGGIYLHYGGINRTISNNIIGNGIGSVQGINSYPYTGGYLQAMGIYLDDGGATHDVRVLDNTVFNCSSAGILWAIAYDCVFKGNTVFTPAGIVNNSRYTSDSTYTTYVKDNISFGYRTLQFGYITGIFSPLIEMDSNYYCRPSNPDLIIYVPSMGLPGERLVSLYQWQKYSGLDLHSNIFPVSGDGDVYFYYNDSQHNKRIWTFKRMIDVKGNKYSWRIVLAPYTSVILM